VHAVLQFGAETRLDALGAARPAGHLRGAFHLAASARRRFSLGCEGILRDVRGCSLGTRGFRLGGEQSPGHLKRWWKRIRAYNVDWNER
jgi:hypothetical protein